MRLVAALIALPLWLLAQDAALNTVPKPAPISLAGIHIIYIEEMDNDLDDYIRAEITKQFKGALTVALNHDNADAIMLGSNEHQKGTKAAVTGRWLGLHDTATGAVSVIDPKAEVILWSSEAGDRSIWWGALKRGGPRKVADRLINNLKKAVDESNKRQFKK